MKKEDAKTKFCPFSFNTNEDTSLMRCENTECMAWIIDQTIDETDEHGHCELIHTR